MGRLGSCNPARGATHRVGDGAHRLVLADDALLQRIFHLEELVLLAFQHLVDRDAGPARHDGGDLLGRHRFLGEGVGLLVLDGLELALETGDHAIAELAGAGEVALALRDLDLHAGLVELFLQALDVLDRFLLLLPFGGEDVGLLLELGEVVLQGLQPVLRRGVGFLLERRLLDLELHDAAVELVELFRLGVDLHAQARRRLVHQVDGLVGQEAVGDVAVGKLRRGDERAVGDAHAVMDLVLLLEAAQDGDGVLHRRLVDEDGLEAPRQSGVLLDIFAVFVERGGADAMQLAARQRGLEQVGRVHRALGRAGPHQGVQLVDEEDDVAFGGGDLAQNGLQPLLELAAEFGAGYQRAHVERHQLLVAQGLGHVAVHDAQGETLGDGGLADAGLADEDGIVLGAARQHLDGAADLLVAADHRIELAGTRGLGEVAGVFLERVVAVLCRGAVGVAALAQVGDRLVEIQRGDAGGFQDPGALGAAGDGQRQQQVFGGDEAVAGLLGDRFRIVEQFGGVGRQIDLAGLALDLGELRQRALDPRPAPLPAALRRRL